MFFGDFPKPGKLECLGENSLSAGEIIVSGSMGIGLHFGALW